MSTLMPSVPVCSNPHAPRPHNKQEPKIHYRPFLFSDKDLLAIDTIQRTLLSQQKGKTKAAVSMAHAVRSAIHSYAAQLQTKAGRRLTPLERK